MAIPFPFYFISRTAKDPFLHVKNEHFNIYVPARAELGVEEMTIVVKFLFIYLPSITGQLLFTYNVKLNMLYKNGHNKAKGT